MSATTISRQGLLQVLESPGLQRRFKSKIQSAPCTRPGLGACGLWTGATHKRDGYGVFGVRIEGQLFALKAHQVGFVVRFQRLPDGPVVRHECDTPLCVLHVIDGTHADNVRDKIARGRQPHSQGHHNAKLTDEQVRAMRKARSEGTPLSVLAAFYGVSEGQVSMISRHLRWKQVV